MPAAPAPTAIQPVNNGAYRLDITEDGGTTWKTIAGLNNFTATEATTTADNSDFNSGLYGSDVPTQKKTTVTATVLRRTDGTAYDAGQEAVRISAETSDLMRIRWYDSSFVGGESKQADAYPQWAPQGGNQTTIQMVNLTFNVQGKPETVPHPNTTTPPPLWTASTPYTLGTMVRLSGGQTLEVTTAGTSGTAEPVAPAAVGGTVVNGTVTFTRRS